MICFSSGDRVSRTRTASAEFPGQIEASLRHSREEGENLSDGDLAGRREVHNLLMSRIEERSRELASYERVKKIAILEEPLTEERGEVTPTMKVRREKVTGEFKDRLEALYGSG